MINFSDVLVLLDFPIHIYTYEIIHYIFKGAHVGISNNLFMYLSIDPEGMPFHLGLHCLPRYMVFKELTIGNL